jgi:hypothetical protein
MSANSTTSINASSGRYGHAAVAAILSDMDRFLPAETIDRPGYKQCRITYGLMNMAYQRSELSSNPGKEYKELQGLERDLRRRLNLLDAAKGIPPKMTQYLDELKNAIDDALTKGVTTDFLIQGIEDILDDKPEAQPEKQPERVKMVTDTKYKKVKAELAEAQIKIFKLNGENKSLALRVKQLESECDRLSKAASPTPREVQLLTERLRSRT